MYQKKRNKQKKNQNNPPKKPIKLRKLGMPIKI